MTEKKKERVLTVGVKVFENAESFESSMIELRNLVKTADGEVVKQMTQNLQDFDRRFYIGKGKLAEIKEWIDAEEIDTVVFNNELSPRQANNLEEELDVKVIDRVQLILDIFAMRARSKEGMLQVELAQMNYLSQRLSGGSGKSLSRQGGGIGSRGAGESKLETDRRHIRYRIGLIKKELKEISKHRERLRNKRKESQVFRIGLIGYTNAGKSTILNMLTTAGTYEENQLFATLDPLTKQWVLPQGTVTTITDTVGFIQDLPTQLIEAFQSTLEESRDVDLLLHVIDASAPDRRFHEETVLNLLKELEMDGIPIFTVYNKADKIQGVFQPTLYPHAVISAKSSSGKDILFEVVKAKMMEICVPYDIEFRADQAKELYEIKRETLLIFEEYVEERNSYHVKGFAKENSRWLTYGHL